MSVETSLLRTVRCIDAEPVLRDAASQAYRIVSASESVPIEDIHRRGFCKKVTNALIERAGIRGLACVPDWRTGKVPGWQADIYWNFDFHTYPALEADTDIIADPTWQQFLVYSELEIPANAPRMLFGPRELVIQQARDYGISDPRILAFWEGPRQLRPPGLL